MEFITKSTKVRSIVASAVTAVALITLIMLSSLLQLGDTSRNLMCLIYTISLLLVLIFWHGIIQIKVFSDYKSQNKWLCADGVLSICLSALLAISAILFGVLQASTAINSGYITGNVSDIRLFLIAFLAVMLIWKLSITIFSIKRKRFNWYLDLIITVCWLALTTIAIVSLFLTGNQLEVLSWIISIVGWVLIAATITDTLYSYVFRQPDYLETARGIELKEKEEKEYEVRQQRLDSAFSFNESKLDEKLKKLASLKEQGFISTQEYNKRRKELLDREL